MNYDDEYDDDDGDANQVAPGHDPTAHVITRADPTAVQAAPIPVAAAPEPEAEGGDGLPQIGEGILKFSAIFSAPAPAPPKASSSSSTSGDQGRKRAREQPSLSNAAVAEPRRSESAEARLFAPSQRVPSDALPVRRKPSAHVDPYMEAEARLLARRRHAAPDSEEEGSEEEDDDEEGGERSDDASDAAQRMEVEPPALRQDAAGVAAAAAAAASSQVAHEKSYASSSEAAEPTMPMAPLKVGPELFHGIVQQRWEDSIAWDGGDSDDAGDEDSRADDDVEGEDGESEDGDARGESVGGGSGHGHGRREGGGRGGGGGVGGGGGGAGARGSSRPDGPRGGANDGDGSGGVEGGRSGGGASGGSGGTSSGGLGVELAGELGRGFLNSALAAAAPSSRGSPDTPPSWLDDIVWDDDAPPWGADAAPPVTEPLIDLNDPYVLLDIDLSPQQQEGFDDGEGGEGGEAAGDAATADYSKKRGGGRPGRRGKRATGPGTGTGTGTGPGTGGGGDDDGRRGGAKSDESEQEAEDEAAEEEEALAEAAEKAEAEARAAAKAEAEAAAKEAEEEAEAALRAAPLAARLVASRAFDLSMSEATIGFADHKLVNPMLRHLEVARGLNHPPLQLDGIQLRRRHRPLRDSLPRSLAACRVRCVSQAGGGSTSGTDGTGGGKIVAVAAAPTHAAGGGGALWRGDETDLLLGDAVFSASDAASSSADAPAPIRVASAVPGSVLLTEYLEEHPSLLNRPGMASRILSYAERKPGRRVPLPAVGERRWIESSSELPFVLGARLPEDTHEMSALHTNLACAPMQVHETSPNRFLLVITTRTAEGGADSHAAAAAASSHDRPAAAARRSVTHALSLRPIRHTVLVGQQQPVAQPHQVACVPRPGSREFKDLLYRRISFAVHQRVFGRRRASVSLAQAMLDWPRSLAPRVKAALDAIGEQIRDGIDRGKWKLRTEARLDRAGLEATLSPEEAALLDAALEGGERLKQLHIKRLTDGRDLHKHLDSISGDVETRAHNKLTAHYITEELTLTPWVLTANFAEARRGSCQLALAGIADPTGNGSAFSYTRLRTAKETAESRLRAKSRQKAAGAAAEAIAAAQAAAARAANPADALDLSKMNKEQMVKWLAEQGENRDAVSKMSRRELMVLIRSKRSNARDDDEQGGEGGEGGAPPVPTAEQLRALGEDIWRKQLELIRAGSPGAAQAAAQMQPGGGISGGVVVGGGASSANPMAAMAAPVTTTAAPSDDSDSDSDLEALAAEMDTAASATPDERFEERELARWREEREARAAQAAQMAQMAQEKPAANGGGRAATTTTAAATSGGSTALVSAGDDAGNGVGGAPGSASGQSGGGGGAAEGGGSSIGPPPRPAAPGKRWVQKTVQTEVLMVTSWQADAETGVLTKKVDISDDPEAIRRHHERMNQDAKRQQQVQSENDKQRKREAEQLAKKLDRKEDELKKRAAAQKMLQERHARGIFVLGDVMTVRCGVCSEFGHPASSKLCPFYGLKRRLQDEGQQDAYVGGVVQQKLKNKAGVAGNFVTIDTSKVKTTELKVKIDQKKLEKSDAWQKKKEEEDLRKHVRGEDRVQTARTGRKAGSALVKLNDLILQILEPLMKEYPDFVDPVADQVGQYYLRVIEKPMDMFSMKKRARAKDDKDKYQRSTEFRDDIDLMISNCKRYNTHKGGEYDLLIPKADKLLAAFHRELQRNEGNFAEYDAQLEAEATAPKLERRYKSVSGAAAMAQQGKLVGNALPRSHKKKGAASAAAMQASSTAAASVDGTRGDAVASATSASAGPSTAATPTRVKAEAGQPGARQGQGEGRAGGAGNGASGGANSRVEPSSGESRSDASEGGRRSSGGGVGSSSFRALPSVSSRGGRESACSQSASEYSGDDAASDWDDGAEGSEMADSAFESGFESDAPGWDGEGAASEMEDDGSDMESVAGGDDEGGAEWGPRGNAAGAAQDDDEDEDMEMQLAAVMEHK